MRLREWCAAGLILGTAVPTVAADLVSDWRIENHLGYTRPSGPMGRAFGQGVDIAWGLGRRLFGDVVGETTASFGSVGYSNASVVNGEVCTLVGRGLPLCSVGATKQEGRLAEVRAGLRTTVWVRRERALAVGAGALWQRDSVSPAGEAMGRRAGSGVYSSLTADLLPLGTFGSVGVAACGAVVIVHGDSLGAALPARTTDRWLDLNAFVSIGRGRRRQP